MTEKKHLELLQKYCEHVNKTISHSRCKIDRGKFNCFGLDCDECIFRKSGYQCALLVEDTNETKEFMLDRWWEETGENLEKKEKKQLTQEEYTALNFFTEQFGSVYIARDGDGKVYLHQECPQYIMGSYRNSVWKIEIENDIYTSIKVNDDPVCFEECKLKQGVINKTEKESECYERVMEEYAEETNSHVNKSRELSFFCGGVDCDDCIFYNGFEQKCINTFEYIQDHGYEATKAALLKWKEENRIN